MLGQEPDVASPLSPNRAWRGQDSCRPFEALLFGGRGCAAFSQGGYRRIQEALMVRMRSDRARDRARDLLATYYPVPDDAESQRLRELSVQYIQEAERIEAENKGHVAESDELISAALDAVARDYFARTVIRAKARNRS